MPFNNDPGVKPAPNFAIREQGMRAPTMDVSGFFKGIGDLFTESATVRDNNNQKDIEDRIRSETEVSNDIVTNGQYSAQTAANAPSDQLPPDLNKSFDRLSTLNNAYQQGKVNEAAYWARLNAVAKELRVKYPNYDSIIDQKFSSITGHVPGNRLRDQLISDADARNKNQSTLEKERRADMDRWATAGVLHPQYRELYAQGEEGWAKIQDHAYRLQQEDAQKKRILQNWEMKKKGGELEQDEVYRQTNTMIQNHVDNIFKTSFDSVSKDGMQGFLELINKAKDPNSPGGTVVTDAEMQQVTQVMSQVKAGVMASVDSILHTADKNLGNASPASYFTDLKRVNDLRQSALDRVNSIEDLVVNKQYGLLVWNKAMMDNMLTADSLDAQKRDEFTRRIMRLRQTLGDQAVNFYLQGHIKELNKAVDVRTLGDAVTGAAADGKPVSETLTERKASASATKATINASVGVLTDAKTSAPVRTNMIKSLFGERNNDFLTKFSSGEQAQVYGKLVNPSVSQAVREASKTNPKLWDNYKNWATTSALPAISRGAIKSLDSIQAQSGGNISFEFNGTQFVMKDKSPTPDRKYDMGKGDMFAQAAREPLQNLNSILGAYKSVLEAEGSDVNKGMSELFERLHMRPKEENQDSIWDKIKDGVNDWFHSSFSSTGDNVTQGSKGVSGKLPVQPEGPFPGSTKRSATEAGGETARVTQASYSPAVTQLTADARGNVNPDNMRNYVANKISQSKLNGFVPIDGAKYGITTGSPAEWANFITGLAYHESGLNTHNVGDVGQFGSGSRGLLQLSVGDAQTYGLNGGQPFTHEQLADPTTNTDAALRIIESLVNKNGMIKDVGRYYGPISREGWTPGNGRDKDLPWTEWKKGVLTAPLSNPNTLKMKESDPLDEPNDKKVILEFAQRTLNDRGLQVPTKLDKDWYDYWNKLYNAIGKPARK